MDSQLTDLGNLIFFDRYSRKDHNRENIKEGDFVVACTDPKSGARLLGYVTQVNAAGIVVRPATGGGSEPVLFEFDHVDKPIEDFYSARMRMCEAIAEAEEDSSRYAQLYYDGLLGPLKYIPGGRVWAGAGVEERLTPYNCSVLPAPHDSRGGIIETLNKMTEIFSRGGGVGIPLMSLRPRFSDVLGVNGRSSGSVSWGKLYAFTTGLIEQGGCLHESCRVLTDCGFVTAGDLYFRMGMGETFKAWTAEGWKGITDRFDSGVQDVYKVTTKKGHTVILTLDHKVQKMQSDATLELTCLRDVEVGDTLALLVGDRIELPDAPLDNVVPQRSEHSSRTKLYTLPSKLSPELCWLAGYFTANGSIRSKSRGGEGIRFTINKRFKEDTNRVLDLLDHLFGYQATVIEGSGDCDVIEVSSVQIEDYLRLNGLLKTTSASARVPKPIQSAGRRHVESFVSGYLAGDGCFAGDQPYLSTASEWLGIDLQSLLLSIGLPCSRSRLSNKKGAEWWVLTFPGMYAQERLVSVLNEYGCQRARGFEPSSEERSWVWPASLGNGLGLTWTQCERVGYNKQATNTSIRAVRRLAEGLDDERILELSKCIPDEVVRIEKYGTGPTFDFTVDGTHKYWVDGFYVSNSRRGALLLSQADWHPDVIEFIQVKTEEGLMENCNMSVAWSDAFMTALEEDADWDLVFPETGTPEYDAEWDGDLDKWKAKGYPIKVYKTLPARELWEMFQKSSWTLGEPGAIFIDTYNRMSNSKYYEEGKIYCTNPCLRGDTRLATADGLIPIVELAESGKSLKVATDTRIEEDYSVSGSKGVELRDAVPAFKTSDAADVFCVSLAGGMQVTATANHKFPTPDGFVELRELRVGDTLLLQSEEGSWGSSGSPEIGSVIGWMQGDGWWSSKGEAVLRFYGPKASIAEPLLNKVRSILGPRNSINSYTVGSVDAIEASSGRLARILGEVGFTKDSKGSTPEVIWRGSRETVCSYLRWFFAADGTVNVSGKSKSCSARYSQSNELLLRETQLLLANLGIVSRLSLRRKAAARKLPDGKGGLKSYFCKDQYELIIAKSNLRKFVATIGFERREHEDKYDAWRAACSRDPYKESFEDSIKSIEFAGVEPTYCTTQPSHHTIIANGVVTGQCGEQGIPPNAVCNLGHINLSQFITWNKNTNKKMLDFAALEKAVELAVRFMDNLIDVAFVPLEEQARRQSQDRRIGLGTMGLAESLIELELIYGDNLSCLEFVDKLYYFIANTAYQASAMLAKEKGPFPAYTEEFLNSEFVKSLSPETQDLIRAHGIRNVALLTQAPTGSVGNMVDTSTGIEPYPWLMWKTKTRIGENIQAARPLAKFLEDNPEVAELRSNMSIADQCQSLEHLPPWFVTAGSITPDDHVAVQAAIQKWVDSSISKTANVPNDFTPESVGAYFLNMYRFGCKGGTVYRVDSRKDQVLSVPEEEPKPEVVAIPRQPTELRSVPNVPYPMTATSIKTAVGKLSVKLGIHPTDVEPFEVWLDLSRAGTALNAYKEALARLISLTLRLPSVLSPKNRLELVIDQLYGIAGGDPEGFGPNKVLSVPDGIAKALSSLLGSIQTLDSSSVWGGAKSEAPKQHTVDKDMCPSCHSETLLRTEGCEKCMSCGYSRC